MYPYLSSEGVTEEGVAYPDRLETVQLLGSITNKPLFRIPQQTKLFFKSHRAFDSPLDLSAITYSSSSRETYPVEPKFYGVRTQTTSSLKTTPPKNFVRTKILPIGPSDNPTNRFFNPQYKLIDPLCSSKLSITPDYVVVKSVLSGPRIRTVGNLNLKNETDLVGKIGLIGRPTTKSSGGAGNLLTVGVEFSPHGGSERLDKYAIKNFYPSRTPLYDKIKSGVLLLEQRAAERALKQLGFADFLKYGGGLYSKDNKSIGEDVESLVTEILHRPEDIFHIRKKK